MTLEANERDQQGRASPDEGAPPDSFNARGYQSDVDEGLRSLASKRKLEYDV